MPFRSIGFPYWTLSPEDWDPVMQGVTALRVPVLRVDVPWSLHEPTLGVYDWGESRPQLALDRVLELAHQRGLLVVVRPGPWLGRPHATGGIPGWLLDADHTLAVDRSGRRLRVPSVASTRVGIEVRRWLEAVVERLQGHLYPRGAVTALSITEIGPAPSPWPGGALDDSPEAKAFLTQYLTVKYGPKGPPGAAYETPDTGNRGAHEVARRPGSVAWPRDTRERIEAGEVGRRLVVEWAREILGPSPPFLLGEVADHPPGSGGDREATRRSADVTPLAFPTDGFLEYSDLRLLGMRASSVAGLATVSGLPSERPLETTPDELDLGAAVLTLAMSGVRGFDVRSAVPLGDEDFGQTPLARDGRVLGPGEELAEALRVLDAIDHSTLERRTSCLLLCDRESSRLREAHASGAMTPGLGPPRAVRALRVLGNPDGLRDDTLFEGLFDGLRRSAIPFRIGSTPLAPDELGDVDVVVAPTFGCMGRSLAQRLFEWAASGGTLVIGPRFPERDRSGAPLQIPIRPEVKEHRTSFRLGNLSLGETDLYLAGQPVIETPEGVLAAAAPHGRGTLVFFGFELPFGAVDRDPDALTHLSRRLVEAGGLSPGYAPSDPRIETELHESPVRRFLFVANPTGDPREVTIALGPREALREVRGRGEFVHAGQPLRVPARTVLVREVVSL